MNNEKIRIQYDLTNSNSDNYIEIEIGELNLPSGEIIAGDPFFIFNAIPFSKKVPSGKYPVKIYLKKIEENHYRVAFAKLKFLNKQANKWYLAVTGDITIKDLETLKNDEFFGFPVDSGLGCFVDKVTNDLYNKLQDEFYKKNPNGNYYDGILANEFKIYSSNNSYSDNIGDWNNHIVDKEKNLNMIMFSSGWGDGHYPTYWGFNQENELIELTIDFLL